MISPGNGTPGGSGKSLLQCGDVACVGQFDVNAGQVVFALPGRPVIAHEAVGGAEFHVACAATGIDEDRADGGAKGIPDVNLDETLLEQFRAGLIGIRSRRAGADCAGGYQRVFHKLPAVPGGVVTSATFRVMGGLDQFGVDAGIVSARGVEGSTAAEHKVGAASEADTAKNTLSACRMRESKTSNNEENCCKG